MLHGVVTVSATKFRFLCIILFNTLIDAVSNTLSRKQLNFFFNTTPKITKGRKIYLIKNSNLKKGTCKQILTRRTKSSDGFYNAGSLVCDRNCDNFY